jgi:uncharacterized protein DUF4232
MTNKSTSSCALIGFPGVDLRSASVSWSLARSADTPKAAVLSLGKAAHFAITYLPWSQSDGEEFKTKSIVLTVPDETTPKTLSWPGEHPAAGRRHSPGRLCRPCQRLSPPDRSNTSRPFPLLREGPRACRRQGPCLGRIHGHCPPARLPPPAPAQLVCMACALSRSPHKVPHDQHGLGEAAVDRPRKYWIHRM